MDHYDLHGIHPLILQAIVDIPIIPILLNPLEASLRDHHIILAGPTRPASWRACTPPPLPGWCTMQHFVRAMRKIMPLYSILQGRVVLRIQKQAAGHPQDLTVEQAVVRLRLMSLRRDLSQAAYGVVPPL